MMKVEIWSDVMCPFCYIGKRNFEQALTHFNGKEDVEVEWKSFQLDPTIKYTPNVSVVEYLAKSKGISKEESVAMHDRVVGLAQNAGLDFHFENAVIANSFKAHTLLQFAKENKKGNELKELLLKGYFTEGMNMEEVEELVERGVKVGLSEAEIRASLSDATYQTKVKEDINLAAQFGVRGVPFFVFDRKYAVSGAQPADVFTQVLDKSYSEWKNTQPSIIQMTESGGDSCDIDGTNC